MDEIAAALRRLWRRPGRPVLAAATLSIGIGATTAAFAALDRVLLEPLPVEDQRALVVGWHLATQRGELRIPFRPRSYDRIVRDGRGFVAVAGYLAWPPPAALVEGADGAYELRRTSVVGDFFGVLGARAALGRLSDARDDVVGAPPVAVLSHSAWRGRFAGDSTMVGRDLVVDGVTRTIVGVAPPGLAFPRRTDLWLPVAGDYADWPLEGPGSELELHLLGRVPPGTDPAAAAESMHAALLADPDPEAARTWADLTPVVRRLDDEVLGPVRPIVRAGTAAALLLLAVAAANAILLMLAGGRAAARDLALRRALGAPRSRIVGAVLADAALVGITATAGGWALAHLGVATLVPLAPAEIPRLEGLRIGWNATVFAVIAGLAAVILVGGTTGAILARSRVSALASAAHGRVTDGAARLRSAVAGLQVALTVLTATGAGLLLRTVDAIDRLDPGFAAEDMVTVALRPPYPWMDVPPSYLETLAAVVVELEGRPGIRGVRPSLGAPLAQRLEMVVRAEEQTDEEAARNPYASVDAVLPGHFVALGIEVVDGRGLVESDDRPEAEPVVVVDEVFAAAYWPGERAVGKRINGFGHFETWFRVVGVAGATRYRELLTPHPRVYYPLRRLGTAPPNALLVRADPEVPVLDLVRDALARTDPSVRVLGATALPVVLREPTLGRRFAAGVLLFFAGATLALATLGVFGVFSLAVQERTREMGVRRALGARPAGIVGLVLGATLRVAAIGAGAGMIASLWATATLESLLYGVGRTDPATLVTVLGTSVIAAGLASLVPALRAARTDPGVSLRTE